MKSVTIIDIRYSLGANEINVEQDINKLAPTDVGKAIEDIIVGVQKSLEEKGISPFIGEFKRQLTSDYRLKLEKMGVNPKINQVRHSSVFEHVLRALVDVLSQASTQRYAVFAMNSFLRKVDATYDFLKNIKVNPVESNELCDISIMTNLDEISETDIRRAIQKLLEEIAISLGEELGEKFIEKFKNSLEKSYLLRIEEMGVNLHLIQLRQEYLVKK